MPWSTVHNWSVLWRLLADPRRERTPRIWVPGGGAGGDAPDPQASALGLPCDQPQPPPALNLGLLSHPTSTAPTGPSPPCRYFHNAINSFLANAIISTFRNRVLPRLNLFLYH